MSLPCPLSRWGLSPLTVLAPLKRSRRGDGALYPQTPGRPWAPLPRGPQPWWVAHRSCFVSPGGIHHPRTPLVKPAHGLGAVAAPWP